MSPFEPPPDSAVGRILARVSEEAADEPASNRPVSLDALLSLPLVPAPVRKTKRSELQRPQPQPSPVAPKVRTKKPPKEPPEERPLPPPVSRVKQFITDADGICTGVVLDVRDYRAMLAAFGETDQVLERLLGAATPQERSPLPQKLPYVPSLSDIRNMTDAAALLGVSRPTLYGILEEGRIGRKIQGKWVITQQELEAERVYRAEHPKPIGRPRKERRRRRKG